MFDRLVQLVIDFAGLFKFWQVVRPYQQAVCYTLGRRQREVFGPGLHLIFPFMIDEVVTENVVPEGLNLGVQSFTLKDGTALTIDTEVMYRVTDVDAYLNNVENAESVLMTMLPGLLQQWIFALSWEELMAMRAKAAEDGRRSSLERQVMSEVNKVIRSNNWGMEVTMVVISQFVRTNLRDSVHRVIG